MLSLPWKVPSPLVLALLVSYGCGTADARDDATDERLPTLTSRADRQAIPPAPPVAQEEEPPPEAEIPDPQTQEPTAPPPPAPLEELDVLAEVEEAMPQEIETPPASEPDFQETLRTDPAEPERGFVVPSKTSPKAIRVPAGTRLETVLDEEIRPQEAAPGDRFDVSVTDDVLDPTGMILIPVGARLLGRVVEAPEGGVTGGEEFIHLVITTLRMNGREYALSASLREAETEGRPEASGAETATRVAAGAAAGALLGRIIGKDKESTVAGALAGAVAGTAVALATRGSTLILPAGARLVFELDRELRLEDLSR